MKSDGALFIIFCTLTGLLLAVTAVLMRIAAALERLVNR